MLRKLNSNLKQVLQTLPFFKKFQVEKMPLDKIDSTKLGQVEGWSELWQSGIHPWHNSQVNPKLAKHWPLLVQASGQDSTEKCRFFVPLCGKSKDLLFLASQGFDVVGCEGVAKACVDFFEENSIEFDLTKTGQFECYQAKSGGKIKLVCGDFFKITPNDLDGKFDCAWDRGSLVAIPVEKRAE